MIFTGDGPRLPNKDFWRRRVKKRRRPQTLRRQLPLNQVGQAFAVRSVIAPCMACESSLTGLPLSPLNSGVARLDRHGRRLQCITADFTHRNSVVKKRLSRVTI